MILDGKDSQHGSSVVFTRLNGEVMNDLVVVLYHTHSMWLALVCMLGSECTKYVAE